MHWWFGSAPVTPVLACPVAVVPVVAVSPLASTNRQAFVYDQALLDLLYQVLDLETDPLKFMLVTASYAPRKSDEWVSVASDAEVAATNYGGGYGGTGRKPVAATVVKDTSTHAVRVVFASDLLWPSLGGTVDATIAGAVLIKELAGSDGSSRLVAYWALANPMPTNGSDIALGVDPTNGNIAFPV